MASALCSNKKSGRSLLLPDDGAVEGPWDIGFPIRHLILSEGVLEVAANLYVAGGILAISPAQSSLLRTF